MKYQGTKDCLTIIYIYFEKCKINNLVVEWVGKNKRDQKDN